MSSVYGPVPSRRLGQSLGVDPVPFKTCNYNCVYCQLGRTRRLTCERKDYLDPAAIESEIDIALAGAEAGTIDYVTFVGQGEPLLCASLGLLVRHVRISTHIPIAVITNGSLLSDVDARRSLADADVVIPSLDAASQDLFLRINRPRRGLRIDQIVEGMATFRREFAGQVWIEVMLLKGLNDGEEALAAMCEALRLIQPHRIHINLPVRPPSEACIEAPDEEGLRRATQILGEAASVVGPYEGTFKLTPGLSLSRSVEEIIRRHPMSEVDVLTRVSDGDPRAVEVALANLERLGRAEKVSYQGTVFWRHVAT